MDEFERLLETERLAVTRFVRFRISTKEDADDVLQEIYLAACQKFSQLKNRESFKAWIISIARNKCTDYFRQKAKLYEIPIDEIAEEEFSDSRYGISVVSAVKDTLDLLGDKDRQILYLYFWKELPQAEIAKQLHIPVGTVKSRLYTAKQHFKANYSNYEKRVISHNTPESDDSATDLSKGKSIMKDNNKLPEFLPEYTITASPEPSFPVKWEELMGWFLVPRLGEKLSWGMYDIPSRKCSYIYDMQVTGKAKVHGIEGVELTARETSCSDENDVTSRTFIAQLTDTHCRYLATLRNDGDVRNYITFLDGDEFIFNWGFGEDNCGNETNLKAKGDIKREGSTVTSAQKGFLLDIVGRYTVAIGGKSYDTVCVMDIETYNGGVVSEQFLDKEGRTVLWRRFNRDDWAIDHYKRPWSEQLPENERLTVNGTTYVHWYDCVTDHIL